MRYIISAVIVIVAFFYFRDFHAKKNMDYPVKAKDSKATMTVAQNDIKYRVNGVRRFLGTNMTNPKGTFTYRGIRVEPPNLKPLYPTVQFGPGRIAVPNEWISELGLEPKFSFWEKYGRWVLLVILIGAALIVIKGT